MGEIEKICTSCHVRPRAGLAKRCRVCIDGPLQIGSTEEFEQLHEARELNFENRHDRSNVELCCNCFLSHCLKSISPLCPIRITRKAKVTEATAVSAARKLLDDDPDYQQDDEVKIELFIDAIGG